MTPGFPLVILWFKTLGQITLSLRNAGNMIYVSSQVKVTLSHSQTYYHNLQSIFYKCVCLSRVQECYTNSLMVTVECYLSNHAHEHSEDICSTDNGKTRNIYKMLIGNSPVKKTTWKI